MLQQLCKLQLIHHVHLWHIPLQIRYPQARQKEYSQNS